MIIILVSTQMARTKQTARLTPKELAELEAERKRIYRARVVQQPKKAKRVKKAKTMKKAKKPKTVEVNFIFFLFSPLFIFPITERFVVSSIFSEHFVGKSGTKVFFGKFVHISARKFVIDYWTFYSKFDIFRCLCW